jgi:hypothetical protein
MLVASRPEFIIENSGALRSRLDWIGVEVTYYEIMQKPRAAWVIKIEDPKEHSEMMSKFLFKNLLHSSSV